MVQREVRFTCEVVVEPDDGSFHAYCPALKGLHADGNTEAEALDNAVNAVKAYLVSLIKHNDPIPLSASLSVEVVSAVRHEREVLVPVG